MDSHSIIKSLYDTNCIKYGDFTLKNGESSNIYIDLRNLISHPKILKNICSLIYNRIAIQYNKKDLICGIPYGAIPYACYISTKYNYPMIMLRKEQKQHGTKKMIEGNFKRGDSCILIEDVITTGASLLESISVLEEAGLVIKQIIVIIDRQNGGMDKLLSKNYLIESLFTKDQLINPNSLSLCLTNITVRKKTNLIFSADVETKAELFQLIEQVGEHICILKTHIDILKDFDESVITKLKQYSKYYNFLILEDKKFCDIGNTIKHQLTGGIYKISTWADIVTVHGISGPDIIKVFKEKEIGVLLIAEMSSTNNLIDETYTENIKNIAENNKDTVLGFICQNKISTYNNFINCAPGVNINESSDSLGQTYNTPDTLSNQGINYFIVGRGIYSSSDPTNMAIKYKHMCYTNRS
jgi:uridine monophosphate synthetase